MTLVFMLAGIGMLIPVMLVYNGFQYLAFRGKILQLPAERDAVSGEACEGGTDPDGHTSAGRIPAGSGGC
jgi:hypothetical protein